MLKWRLHRSFVSQLVDRDPRLGRSFKVGGSLRTFFKLENVLFKVYFAGHQIEFYILDCIQSDISGFCKIN